MAKKIIILYCFKNFAEYLWASLLIQGLIDASSLADATLFGESCRVLTLNTHKIYRLTTPQVSSFNI